MILLDKPYVSDFLKDTILQNEIPVIETEVAKSFDLNNDSIKVSEIDAIEQYKEKPFLIYTNSENAIDWVNKNLSFSE
ncbi:MAG: ATP-grasp domain-containing protein, partial [Bacteroidetes bacterium]|nr:ATP-grasp domain-containing protein [Bacteroidota bacterium]